MKRPDRFNVREVIFTVVAFALLSLIARFAQADALTGVVKKINKSASLSEAVEETLVKRDENFRSDLEKYLMDKRAEKPGKVQVRDGTLQIWSRNSLYLLDLTALAKGKISFNGHQINYDHADSPAVLLYKLEAALPQLPDTARAIDSVFALNELAESPAQGQGTTPSAAGVIVTAAMTVIAVSK